MRCSANILNHPVTPQISGSVNDQVTSVYNITVTVQFIWRNAPMGTANTLEGTRSQKIK